MKQFLKITAVCALALVATLSFTGKADAFYARLCNDGNVQILVGVVGKTGVGGWYAHGWHPVQPRRCWGRGSIWEREFYFSYQYQDAAGNWGFGKFTGTTGLFHYFKVSSRKFCVDEVNAFHRVRSFNELQKCPPNLVSTLFPIWVGGEKGETYELSLKPDKFALHSVGQGQKPAQPDNKLNAQCNAGDVSACTELYHEILSPEGRLANDAESAQAFKVAEKGCNLGSAMLCFNAAAYLYDLKDVMALNKLSARRYFEKGCELGRPISCHYAGRMYIKGDAGTPDTEKGVSLLDKGCHPVNGKRSYAKSCYGMAAILEDPKTKPYDLARAKVVWAELCEATGKQKYCDRAQ